MTSGGESGRLSEAYSIASPAGRPIQTAFGTLNRQSHAAMDPRNPEDGLQEGAARADCKLFGESMAMTDLKQVADRGHSLTIDGRRREVADFALGRLTRRGISATAPTESRFQ